MAEKPVPRLLVTVRPDKQARKRKTEEERRESRRLADKSRSQTRINVGVAFQRWRKLREFKALKSDAELAVVLLDRLVFWSGLGSVIFHTLYKTSH